MAREEGTETVTAEETATMPLVTVTSEVHDRPNMKRTERETDMRESVERTVRQRVADIESQLQVQTRQKDNRKRVRERGEEAEGISGGADKRTNLGGGSDAEAVGDPEPWMREPEWMPTWLHRKKDGRQQSREGEQEATGSASTSSGGALSATSTTHHLMNVGPLLFCNQCGAYGLSRAGSKLMGTCAAVVSRDVRKRLERMRAGLHPITGAAIG